MENYQKFLKMNNLISEKQFIDFSSSYFEGNSSELEALGYSRDNQPGKKQLIWGISTGINDIPIAMTIQKGNVQDKKTFWIYAEYYWQDTGQNITNLINQYYP